MKVLCRTQVLVYDVQIVPIIASRANGYTTEHGGGSAAKYSPYFEMCRSVLQHKRVRLGCGKFRSPLSAKPDF